MGDKLEADFARAHGEMADAPHYDEAPRLEQIECEVEWKGWLWRVACYPDPQQLGSKIVVKVARRKFEVEIGSWTTVHDMATRACEAAWEQLQKS